MQLAKPWFYERDPEDMDRATLCALVEYLREELECVKEELSASKTGCDVCDLCEMHKTDGWRK